MTYLCLDTSTRTGSMALVRDGGVTSAVHADPRSHAERLPLEAIAWMAAQGVTLADVDVFVVVSGPGSFTGLRVGIACAQGWAFACGKPLAAVPSLDALAAGIQAPDDVLTVPMIDGQRGEVFMAARRANDRAWAIAPCVESPAAAAARARAAANAGHQTAHPTQPPVVLAAGDGADRYRDVLAAEGISVVTPRAPLAALAVELVRGGQFAAEPPGAAQPIYIRRTDAELARERRERGQ